MTKCSGLLMAVSLASAGALGFSQPAGAQTTAADQVLSEIVVTGSRLIANGNNMPTPVTVVTAENLATLKPTTIIDALNLLPVFAGSRTQQFTGTPTGGTGGGAAASNQLSLRNLGPLRTLVLFDGQRVAPTSLTNVVDADIIPQMLIQRVDVVTGGASAVYGSDAMVGVVNFLPDRNFNGVKLQAQAGQSSRNDNKNWKGGIAAGMPLFSGRGHIEGSVEAYNNDGVPSRASRDWYVYPSLTGAGTAANPLTLLTNVRTNQNTAGGLITSGVLTGQKFGSNGVLSTFVRGIPTGTPNSDIGGDGFRGDAQLVAALRWTQGFGRLDYDLSDRVHGQLQAGYKHMLNRQSVGYFTNNNFTYSSTNPFLPLAYRNQLATANQSTFRMSQTFDQAPQWEAEVYSDQLIANAGLEGDLNGYKWNLGFNYGQADLTDYLNNVQNNQHLAAALDVIVHPTTGQTVCRVTVTTPAIHPGCVPLNPFGPTAASREAVDYVYQTLRWDGVTKMYDANAGISAQPFNTWAGPVGVALSAEWRRTTFASMTDDPSTKLANCTGITLNCAAGQVLWQNAFSIRSKVGIDVAEGAVEFDVPLLKDAPLVRSLSLNGAVRYMSYSESGDFTAWKLGLVWEANDKLRFRGTVSRDIRAPTINDLFAPPQVMPTTADDLLTGQRPTVLQYREGNPELTAEIGETKTVGVVYSPAWLPGLSLSLDAFDINVDGAIIEIRGVNTSAQQACYASLGASTYCQLQQRPLGYTNTSAANAVTAWGQKFINIASLRTYGADFEGNYVGKIHDHAFALRAHVTWQPHVVLKTPGLADLDSAGVAQAANPTIPSPQLRITATESLNVTEKFRIDLTERGRSSLRMNGDKGLVAACCTVSAIGYLDLNLSYALKDLGGGDGEIFLNTSNLLDKDHPVRPELGFDDVVGRAYVGGVRFRF